MQEKGCVSILGNEGVFCVVKEEKEKGEGLGGWVGNKYSCVIKCKYGQASGFVHL